MPQPLEIVVNRRGGVPVREQLVTQLELKILDGTLSQGQRLPSVRTLARSLKVHHNTVSAAYQDLKASGHVELQRGSGVFVCRGGPVGLPDARGLDEMIRVALHAAFRKGFTGSEVRAAVERWLAAVPPERVLVVDPSLEMGELLAHEIRQALKVPASATSLEALGRDPGLTAGALAVVLPYHVEAFRRAAPSAGLEVVTLEVPAADRDVVRALPMGSIVLFVSHSPTVLPFASGFLSSLRGDEILVEVRLLSETREWKRLLKAADLVIADALSVDVLRRAGARAVLELRVVPGKALERVREALTVVVPRPTAAASARPAGPRGNTPRD
jgi:DNA-binding transcriptional regulator YhcF (GntR family)